MPAEERKETASDFWERASAWSAGHGIAVRKVLTDNGSCYRSHVFGAPFSAADDVSADNAHVLSKSKINITYGVASEYNVDEAISSLDSDIAGALISLALRALTAVPAHWAYTALATVGVRSSFNPHSHNARP